MNRRQIDAGHYYIQHKSNSRNEEGEQTVNSFSLSGQHYNVAKYQPCPQQNSQHLISKQLKEYQEAFQQEEEEKVDRRIYHYSQQQQQSSPSCLSQQQQRTPHIKFKEIDKDRKVISSRQYDMILRCIDEMEKQENISRQTHINSRNTGRNTDSNIKLVQYPSNAKTRQNSKSRQDSSSKKTQASQEKPSRLDQKVSGFTTRFRRMFRDKYQKCQSDDKSINPAFQKMQIAFKQSLQSSITCLESKLQYLIMQKQLHSLKVPLS